MSHTLKKLIDTTIGTPLCAIAGIFVRKGYNGNAPKQILLVKLWAIGDTITMLPLAKALRLRYPDAKIDMICRHQNWEIAKSSGLFDNVVLFEASEIMDLVSRFWYYDLVFDGEPFLRLSALLSLWMGKARVGFDHDIRRMTYNITSQHQRNRHMVENYLAMAQRFGIVGPSIKQLVPLEVRKQDAELVQGLLSQAGISNDDFLVVMAPNVGAEGKTRLWSPQKWAALAEHLYRTYDAKIVFTGVKSDKEYVKQTMAGQKIPYLDLCGETTLRQTIALVSVAKLVISLDAGIMHISAAQGTPTIGLFGPNVPSLWAPLGEKCRSIYHPLSCSPCINNRTGYIPDCLRITDRYLCMRSITVEETLSTAGELYERYHQGASLTKHIHKTEGNRKYNSENRKIRKPDKRRNPSRK